MNQNEEKAMDATNKLLNTENTNNPKEIENEEVKEKGCVFCVTEIIKRFRGIGLGVLSAFFLALSGIFIRKANFVTASEQTVIRNTLQMIIMIAIAAANKVNIFGPSDQRIKLMVRGLFGSSAILSLAFAVKFIDPSDAQALYSCRLIIISVNIVIFKYSSPPKSFIYFFLSI